MYIWILLATIMVALSFFNLSPRQDKDHSVNEVKAATVVNRFKAEHLAMARYMECEIVKQTNNSNWDGAEGTRSSEAGPVEVKYNGKDSETEPALSYAKVSDFLPIGYDHSSAIQIKHLIYCIDDKAEADGDRHYVACNKTRDRYLVSYAQIPDKWLSHEEISGKSRTPAPLFMTFVSKSTSGGSTYGWTDCMDNTCILRGYSSRAGKYTRDQNKTQIYEYTLLSGKSILWSVAKTDCRAHPCLFAYMHLPVSDVANHCCRLMHKDDESYVCGKQSSSADTGGDETPSGTGD